jgi:[ribosomal protein S18]-alanine N-acetyltransferase
VALPIIEPMRLGHLDRVLEIEEASFPQPYSRELFEEELSLDIASPQVVRLNSLVVGYIDYWTVKGEIHLINIAVDPAYRKLHIASFMMEHLIQDAQEKGAEKIFLDVRQSNAAAISLYEKFGFKKTGVRRRYYSDNGENALVMVREL